MDEQLDPNRPMSRTEFTNTKPLPPIGMLTSTWLDA